MNVYLLLGLTLLIKISSCTYNSVDSTKKSVLELEEKTIDSIYENFEETAFNQQSSNINNPNTLVEQLKVTPKTAYQKELYTYGLIYIAYTLVQKGDIYESVKYYEKAYNYIEQENIVIADKNSIIIKPLANLYTRINDTEKAISLLEKTIEKNVNYTEIIGLKNNLANAYLYNNQKEKAEKILLETLQITTNRKQKALLCNSLASIYYEKGEIQKSKKYNKIALSSFEFENLKDDTLVWYLSSLGLNAQLDNNLESSKKAIEIAKKEFPNTQNRLKAKLLAIEVDILKDTNNPEILNKNNEIINLFNSDNQKNTLDYTYTKALFEKASYFNTNKLLDSAIYYYEAGIENDFKTQQLITSNNDQIRNNINNRKKIEELITLITENPGLSTNQSILKTLLWCIELSKARLLINDINRSDQWNNSNTDIKIAIQKIQSLYKQKDEATNKTKKEELQEQIDNLIFEFQLSEKYFEYIQFQPNKSKFYTNLENINAEYYSYHIRTNNTVIIIHKDNSSITLTNIEDAIFLNTIDTFKNEYFGKNPNNYNNNPQKYIADSKYICNLLLPQLNKENIFISLDGNLYGLPFDALYKESFLVDKHNFAYLNSFLLFNILEANKNKKKYSISILHRSKYTSPLPTLNFVDKEVAKIKAYYRNESIGTEKQTDDLLKKQFSKSNIIHIAAHTILDSSEAPLIFLKNPISTNQIRYMEIKSPLVFLSACNTGKGESLHSEGMESIQRVFLSKNVPSVISTYWFANDETMLNITGNFYKNLEKSNDPIYALAQAKRDYLATANNQFQNPWYWANINYSGIDNDIGLKKQSSNLYLLGLAMLLILSLYLIFRSRLNSSMKKVF